MKKNIILVLLLLLIAACSGRENLSDAYGNFEAIEVIISSETAGKIIDFPMVEGDRPYLQISVTDTGIGMSPQKQDHCFDEYWSDKKGGTGLGLTIASTLIERMHGRIWVHSRPDEGTTFHFTARFAVAFAQRAGSGPVGDYAGFRGARRAAIRRR